MKKSKTIPVVIEEDHHDVLPHIYRNIGSKRLPLNDVTLVHFDSHPDMLVPLDMPADAVREKQTLFDSLSIENWILPAVYAGHISRVIWVKPPWCSQVEDKHIQCYVGKCVKTGTIRTTCTESYFLSETLYVPENGLEAKKPLTFTIVSLRPENWDTLGEQTACNSHNVHSDESVHNFGTESKSKLSSYEQKSECGVSTTPCAETDLDERGKSYNGKLHDDFEAPVKCDSDLNEVPNVKKRKIENYFSENEDEQSQTSDEKVDLNSACESVKLNVNCSSPTSDKGRQCYPSLPEIFQELSTLLDGKPYVLDIDLDFYSTMNPFQEMYNERQYKILHDLYKYDKPLGESEKDIEKCVSMRRKQLAELKCVFSSLEGDVGAKIIHPRSDLIQELISSLKDSCKVIDYELLHDAGCTFDDTDLPHHVSNNAQIAALVDVTQEALSYLPKPTVITIARSSADDYCPPSQVDFIQEKVLNMLQELYLELNVNFAYV